MKSAWEKIVSIRDGRVLKLAVEIGLSGYELVLYADVDGRYSIAKTDWEHPAQELLNDITEGLAALKKAASR